MSQSLLPSLHQTVQSGVWWALIFCPLLHTLGLNEQELIAGSCQLAWQPETCQLALANWQLAYFQFVNPECVS